LGELAVLEHGVMVVGVVLAQLRDRAGLLGMAAMLGASRCQVAAGSTTGGSHRRWTLIAVRFPVAQFRRIQLRLGTVEGLLCVGRPGLVGSGRATTLLARPRGGPRVPVGSR
jgi:hypothetical protein